MTTADDMGLDELVAALVDTKHLPPHLGPAQLLDADVIPPPRVADKVYALRALVRSGGTDAPLSGRLANSQSVAKHFAALLGTERTESMWVIGCDARCRVRFHRCVARGGVAACAVTMADILRPAVLNACHAIVIVHNHPSGDPSPSAEDTELTKRVAAAAELLGIRMLDHVVVAGSRHFSFLDAGILPPAR